MDMFRQFLPPEIARELPVGAAPSIGFGTIICGAPVGAIFAVLFFAIAVALIQWVAKLFGGTGSFDKLAYAFSAITVPVSVVSAVLALIGIIPIIGISDRPDQLWLGHICSCASSAGCQSSEWTGYRQSCWICAVAGTGDIPLHLLLCYRRCGPNGACDWRSVRQYQPESGWFLTLENLRILITIFVKRAACICRRFFMEN